MNKPLPPAFKQYNISLVETYLSGPLKGQKKTTPKGPVKAVSPGHALLVAKKKFGVIRGSKVREVAYTADAIKIMKKATETQSKRESFTIQTMHGIAEGIRQNPNEDWNLNHPWGSRIFNGTLAEARAELRGIVKQMEAQEKAEGNA